MVQKSSSCPAQFWNHIVLTFLEIIYHWLPSLIIPLQIAYQPIIFGQNATRGQTLYLFDFRFETPTVTKGIVNFADELHFLLGAKADLLYYSGALVFDENCKLVGIVFDHEDSLLCVQVNHLRKLLLDFFPGTKSMDGFYRKLNAAKDFVI